jgi:two-component system, NtrC family, sensor kinase
VPISVQEKFKKNLSGLYEKYNLEVDVCIGDFDYLESSEANDQAYFILLTDQVKISAEKLYHLQLKKPYQMISFERTDLVEKSLQEITFLSNKKNKIESVKSGIQIKRKELEKLNEKLNQESEKQILSLEQSHIEESQKNIKEKSLLHFLDFVQSESVNEDFLNALIKFLWKDLKKIGRLHQIGFSFKAYSEKSNLFIYDGLHQQSLTTPIEFNTNPQAIASQMATLWGRPVGKIKAWALPEFSRQGYFFIEVIDQQLAALQLDAYIKERLVVLSLYLDRWMIEKEYEVIVDRWRRTFDSFSGYVHVIDEDFNIYQANYLKKQIIKSEQKCFQVLAGRAQPCLECPVLNGKNVDFNLKNGLRVKTYSSEFRYNQKKYFFVIYEDVTQLHLLKGQMIHSEKMSALGRLGNHLAHELNNPLTGIKSYVQSILEDPQTGLSATIKSDLNEILKATIRSQNIIKNFIDFSHKSEQKLEKVIVSEVDMKPTAVMANSHDLQQILFNLIKNACQAMTGPGAIKIYEEEKNDKIYFNIEDTGPGFEEEILKNIFEPFMTTKKQGEGTGLGLYLSKKLMNSMNADIQVSQSMSGGQKAGAKISLIFVKL